MSTNIRKRAKVRKSKAISTKIENNNSAGSYVGMRSSQLPGTPSPESDTADLVSPASSKALALTANWESLSPAPRDAGAPPLEFKDGLFEPTLDGLNEIERAFGTTDIAASTELLGQILGMVPIADPTRYIHINSAVAMIRDIAPKDALERCLAAQLWSTQHLASMCLRKATDKKQTDEQVDGHVNRATKMLRCYTGLIESLDRHRGKVPQQMVVGNVNVNSGGQAIVGSIERAGPGKVLGDDKKKTSE